MWKARVVGKQHEEKRFTSNFYVRNMYFGTPRFCFINLSPRGTRKEIVLTSNVKINFVRLNLPQGLQ